MSLLFSALLLPAALQVGMNPNASTDFGEPEELRELRRLNNAAQGEGRFAELGNCLRVAAADPAKGLAQSQRLFHKTQPTARGDGLHCQGFALARSNDLPGAARAYQASLEATGAAERGVRIERALTAASAWTLANNRDQALMLLGRAATEAEQLGRSSVIGEVAVDRAIALVAMGREDEAAEVLSTARETASSAADVWLLSATLSRRMEQMEDAQAQIERAALLNPLDPAVGLEAGVIAALTGRDEAARKSWQSVIDTAPQSPQAATAQRYVQSLSAPEQ